MRKYLLSKVSIFGKKYEISHEFTDDEIEEVIKLPKIGIGISFKKAYEMRFMENHNGKCLINTSLIRKKLSKYLIERGLFIDFEEDELNYVPNEVRQ